MDNERVLRQLLIRAYHITEITTGKKTALHISPQKYGKLVLSEQSLPSYLAEEELVRSAKIRILLSEHRKVHCNSIMDVIPISTKVLGKPGEGITHTLTGVYVVLTGVDEEGTQICSFGSSDGILDEQIKFGCAGTPGETDILITFDVTLKAQAGKTRSGPVAAHRICDKFCQEIRDVLRTKKDTECTEKHTYYDIVRPRKKKVALVKLVAGQGSMYDTQLFGQEPSAFLGGRSVIDMGNMPVLLTPNEYRDGAIRALY